MAKRPVWQDSTYDKQISYYRKLLSDFLAQETRKKADVGTYYGTLGTPDKTKMEKQWLAHTVKPVYRKTKSGKKVFVGWKRARAWNIKPKTKKGKAPTEGLYQQELRAQRERDLRDISSDFGARGLIHSGLYGQKRADYETEFGKQLAEINRQRSKLYQDIAAERTAFEREQELQKENARLEAIRRRAAKTGQILV